METFYLKNCFLNALPESFKYTGNLDCSYSTLTTLPDNLFLNGDLIIKNSPIQKISDNTIIIGNIITDKPLIFGKNVLISGKIKENQQEYFYDCPGHTIYTDDNQRVVFKSSISFPAKKDFDTDYFFPAVTFFHSIDKKGYAVKYTEQDQTFCFFGKDLKNVSDCVDWHRAKKNGLDNFKDLDVYQKRTVLELKKIFMVCSGLSACEKGVDLFLKEFNINQNNLYSINDLREMLKQTKLKAHGKNVFIKYFNPNKQKEAE